MSSSLWQGDRAQAEVREAVAVQAAAGSTPITAHVVPAAMVKLGASGLARCGFPVEYLTLVPELDWSDVTGDDRCPYCDADGA